MSTAVGVPREVKDQERRVSVQPDGVAELVHHGHEVIVEAGAGVGAAKGNPVLAEGLSTLDGDLVSEPVAAAHGLPRTDPGKPLDRNGEQPGD